MDRDNNNDMGGLNNQIIIKKGKCRYINLNK